MKGENAMNITQSFIHPNQFTRPGLPLKKVTAIAVHYAGDPGASAKNIRDYFNGTCIQQKRYASCHYAVGLQGEIIQLIPESEWAYCTCKANAYSVSIETCHPDSSGKFTEAAEQSLIGLCALLCKKYGLNPTGGGLIRHYDVTGKECPLYYVRNPGCWTQFKQSVANCMAGKAYVLPANAKTAKPAAQVDLNYCDTSTLTQCPGMVYTFKTGSPVSCADKSFSQVAHNMDGGYHLTTFRAVSVTPGIGFYANGRRVCVAVIKTPYSDTTIFKKKAGQTYTFKTDFPIVCGTGSVFQQEGVEQKKGYYFTKFRAAGKGDAGFYCGNTRVCVGTVV